MPPLTLLFSNLLAEFIPCFQIPIDKIEEKNAAGVHASGNLKSTFILKQLDFSCQGSVSVKPRFSSLSSNNR